MNLDETPTINVDGLTILGYSGYNRVSLRGEYFINFFADILIDEWIPFFECHQCGRVDYCKFTIPHRGNPDKKKDIKCGVVATVLKNFIKYTCNVFEKLDKENKQKYLDGLYYFQRYVYHSELRIGMFLDKEMLDHAEKFVPAVFGGTSSLRSDLNRCAEQFKDIKEFHIQKGILLVEGWSEKVFIQRMFECGSIWSSSFDIEVYGGKNNKSPKKLQLLINKLKKDGYEVFIQGDQDGGGIDIFQEHKKTNLLDGSNLFQFSHDFETAFPPRLLYRTLCELEIFDSIDFNEFNELIYPCNESVVKKIERLLNIDISDNKVTVADLAAKAITDLNWWDEKEIMGSELGQFLEFLRKI